MERELGNAMLLRLCSIAERVANSTHAEEGLHAVTQAAKDFFDAQSVGIVLLDEKAENLHIKASRGISGAFAAHFSRPVGTGIVAEVALGGMALLLPDPAIDRDAYRDLRLEHEFSSAMAVQLTTNHRPIGYFYCDHRAAGRYERPDLQVLRSLGVLAALALEKSDLYEKVARLAVTDPVTGLYTASYFQTRLASDIARAVRYGESLGAILMEVDHLPRLEEVYGVSAAEDALRHIADLIRENTREVDYAARFSHNRIIICLVRAEENGINRVSQRVLELTSEKILEAHVVAARKSAAAAEAKKGAKPFAVSVYVSGAVAPEHGRGIEEFIASIEQAMTRAKAAGAGTMVMAVRPS